MYWYLVLTEMAILYCRDPYPGIGDEMRFMCHSMVVKLDVIR